MMHLPLGKVAQLLGSECTSPDRLAQGYSIDSRRIGRGELFFAIRGRNLDGHQFVAAALEAGAVGAVVEKGFWERSSPELRGQLIPVADSTEALQHLAREVRRQWGGRLVAITGSMGKTTTKEMVAALISSRLPVLKSPGNLNNYYGLPLTLLQLEPAHQVAVVELAMSAPGEIARLAQIAEPETGVVTNVAPVHLQFFDSIDSIAKAKRELIENLVARNGRMTAVLNFDDARVRQFAAGFNGRVLTFGFGDGAEFKASDVRREPGGGSSFKLRGPDFEAELTLPLPGIHNIENALAALAAASLFGIPADACRETLMAFRNLSGRSEILTLPGDITVLNDCYNSNPRAMERMLETLADWKGAGRRIVVAGEMLELGPASPDLHRQVGVKLAKCGADWLIAVQGDARYIVDGALEAGMNAERALFIPDAPAAGRYCQSLLEAGDVVLVKGSRGVNLEKVTELLRGLSNHPSRICSDVPGRTV